MHLLKHLVDVRGVGLSAFFFFFLSPDDLGFFSDFLAGVFLVGGMTVCVCIGCDRSVVSAILHYLSSTASAAAGRSGGRAPPANARTQRAYAHPWRRRRSCIAHVIDVVRRNHVRRIPNHCKGMSRQLFQCRHHSIEDLDVVRASTLGRRRCYCTICNFMRSSVATPSFLRPIGQFPHPRSWAAGYFAAFTRSATASSNATP